MLNLSFHKRFYFILSFIEGGVVMAVELIGAKMLAPFFGTSLYVWSTVMAITLGGLAAGYFIGGWISQKKKNVNTLLVVTLLAAMFVVLMPMISKMLLNHMLHIDLFFALITTTIIFLLPPVFLMGMVSPLIINLVTTDPEKAGMMSGLVYAISTVGGIVSTFLTGFYIIPNFGLTIPCIMYGILLGAIPFLILMLNRKTLSILFPLICFFSFKQTTAVTSNSPIKILYNKEGLLGQLMVADVPIFDSLGNTRSTLRYLYVNRIVQSVKTSDTINLQTLPYVGVIHKIISAAGITSKSALVLGLGGGGLSTELVMRGFTVDACELDARMLDVSKQFFDMSPAVNVIVDDARHYLETTNKKYDFIIFDVFKGEENPDHLFTQQSFSRATECLNKNGLIIINANGYWDGDIGLGMRSVVKTLMKTRMDVTVFATNNQAEYRNLVFAASWKKINYPDQTLARINIDASSMHNAVLLDDDKPVLDVLNKEANLAWRKGYANSIQQFSNSGIPAFQ